jgi:hypothetical protein
LSAFFVFLVVPVEFHMPAFDLGNKESLDRLHKAIKTSRDAIDVNWRWSHTEMIRAFAGSMYSPYGAEYTTYVNMLNQTQKIYQMALAFNNPQVKVNSWEPKNWPFCRKYETTINRVVANIDFKTTFQLGLADAFFLMGIFWVRMADAGLCEIEPNVWVDPGKPWVGRVSFDDAILDLAMKDIRAMRFCGAQYRASFDAVQERDDYDREVKKTLRATSKFSYDAGSKYAEQIANGTMVDDDDLEPMIWLEDVYLPGKNGAPGQLATFEAHREDAKPLKVVDSDAGPMGPFEFLTLGFVPDNIMPSSPAQNLYGLHLLANRLYRKLAQQAMAQKNTVAYPAGGEDDAERGRQAKDGEFWKCRDPKNLAPINFPGADGNTNVFFMASQELYNTAAGNQRAIGGLGTEANTLGQEEIIQGRVGGMIGYMKGRVNDCASNLCRKIGALMWDDEALTVESSMEAEHTGHYVDSSWRPDDRQGLKDHYDFFVEPNSMGFQSPEMKLQFVMQYWQTVGTVLPLVQAGFLDLQELTKFAAEYRNVPELLRMAKFMQLEAGLGGGGDPHQATKAPVTSREVVRRDRGGGQQGPAGDGMAAVLGQMMMQGRGQSQGAAVGAKR